MISRFFSLSVILIVFWGCKDPCKDVECQNGGVCNDGICDCPEGFEGDNCETDQCAYVYCQNGGTCTNGECDCPEHFSGQTCLDQEEPSRICITRYEVISIPDTANLPSYYYVDSNGYDLGFVYSDSNLSIVYSEIISDIMLDSLPRSIEMEDVCYEEGHWFQFVGVTSASPTDTIIAYNFDHHLYSGSNGFPEYVEIANAQVNFRLYLEYEWQ